MKVLHVIARMDPTAGGVCQALITMAKGLAQLGVQNEIVSLDDPNASYLEDFDFPIHAQGYGRGPWVYHKNLFPWLLENAGRFDAIIIHGLWLYHGYAVRKAIRQLHRTGMLAKLREVRKPKLFVLPHGMLDPYFQQAVGRKLKALRNWAYWKLVEQKTISAANALLFTSEVERQLASMPFRPYRPQKQEVVGLGVEEPPLFNNTMADAFRKKCPGLQDQSYLLFLSRIDQKKGLDMLINVYAALKNGDAKNRLPKLVVAGPGLEKPFGKKMLQLAFELFENEKDIFFVGMLTGDAKWGAFYGCEAFVLPSHQENFGIAVVEAMATGKPVLISDQINIWKELTVSGGGLVAADDVLGTQDLLRRWVRMSDKERLLMGRNARHCYEKNFSIASAAKRVLTVLESNTI